ncbi:MAG: glycoside hydrolase [Gemmatimonadaceae bacterium]|nr:glycoside hydrolase [Gemmatimonadaceae bacterium]
MASLAASARAVRAQSADVFSAMRWRSIGPTRAGRARALSGVPSQPNVFYVGFDNGGVWRSTDYGSTWQPLFDREPTGSIGAIAVAPSDPNIIYVGTGAGIIRPDLAVGNGMYKSTDAGATWTHLGLDDSQMIANVDVDPRDPNRLFVAVLGHPYGPNAERGVFRSTDGGRTFQKVLYKDEYTSANDVRIDPHDPNIVYAALWQQQEGFRESLSFGGAGGGIYKSTDGGTTWRQLTNGLPTVLQANLAIAPSNPATLYATVAGATPNGRTGFGGGAIGFYKSTDGGEHWTLVNGAGLTGRTPDMRPLARIGGGDLPTITVDPSNENVVYSASVVLWRTEDGGVTWSAVRGAPGGDDYQKAWINPTNPNILLVVTDQGAVVSANRGASWSNWYTQPTAAMYHVSIDNAFPYRVCGGQQDAGSACVASRSMDGETTFHDWHPVNIQEYGIAAPDPRDPDLVFGSMRTNVSLYDRRTGQTTYVGPDMSGHDAAGHDVGRNVRTMPIAWSPVNPDVLYYTSNVVWKTTDRGHSWTRISPDLARATWAVPASAGKYASSVTPSPQGAITAFSPSPRNANVLWAGTDDGNIQVTTDGGATWRNVTPPAIKPWTRIFNIDAGHFDDRTAYAAANTLRIDDLNPHFWRTHDGGKTWTEIDNGIAPGAVANSIREDPRQRGLLYAATDQQVWVSFDDGDHWESLRLNMPAISVRDLEVKDDSTCLCADLIAGTHGRGFWILDDVTPLRQAARARAATVAYLFEPITAVRVRFGTNDPTPWPPELPAGENPPPGGIIDYYLAADAPGPVTLEILDSAGTVIRSYSSADPVLSPHPALDPAAYDRLCQRTPTAPYCRLPLYWPAPPMTISTRKGMHRVTWDLHYQPVTTDDGSAADDESATGAVPHRTYPMVNAPWAPPGRYTVRLTVGGKRYTQPLTLRLDPRVHTSPAALAQLARLSREMYDGAVAAQRAYTTARALSARLAALGDPDAAAAAARVAARAPAPPPRAPAPVRRRGAAGAPATLASARDGLLAAAMAMQQADVAPTAREIADCRRARATADAVMARWTALERRDLPALNAKRKAAGKPPVTIPSVGR